MIYLFFTFPYVYVHFHLPFVICLCCLFSQVTKVLSIFSLITPPFPKVCENCHVEDVTISRTCGIYCNIYRSKSTVQKLGFLCGSIVTNDEHVLLTIEGKWLEAIAHMKKIEFLDLLCTKQVQLLILIGIYGKFDLSTTFDLVGFQENI